MEFHKISPTISEFDNCAWQETIEAAETKECLVYSELFAAKAREAQAVGNERAQNALTVLWIATSFRLNDPANNGNPFCPLARGVGIRFLDIDDFTDEHLEVFGQLIPKIEDPELRARIADIVWVRKRGYQVAEQAVRAYLESARNLEDPARWPYPRSPVEERVERAVALSVLHKRSTETFNRFVAHIEDVLDRHKDFDPSYLSINLMEILLERGEGDSAKYSQLAERHALSTQNDEDWEKPRKYWELQARWLKLAKDENGSRAARIKAAEVYVHAAEARLNQAQPNYIAAAELTQSAIEAFQRIGGERERVRETASRPPGIPA